MKDCLDRTISKGNTVVVCHSGGTNSTLIMGVVEEVKDKSIKYQVVHSGKECSYARHPERGEFRTINTEHRVYVVE